MEDNREEKAYQVVVNQGDGGSRQSIWPFGKLVPSGWKSLEVSGNKEKCLEFIRANWNGTDYPPK
jgi:MbtH protein